MHLCTMRLFYHKSLNIMMGNLLHVRTCIIIHVYGALAMLECSTVLYRPFAHLTFSAYIILHTYMYVHVYGTLAILEYSTDLLRI